MSRLKLLLACAVLAAPSAALADPDPVFASFQSLCTASADYTAMLNAATAGGWAEVGLQADADPTVSLTDQFARSKLVGGLNLTIFGSRGLRHTKGGDIPVTTCKISTDKPDAGVLGAAHDWIGVPADGGDATLAVYYVRPGSNPPQHIAQADLNAAMATGGFSIVKVQQDPGSSILVYQTYSK